MADAWRICPARGCPQAIPASARYCAKHAREHEKQRGSREERGYDHAHRSLRKAFIPEVLAGTAKCWRCDEPIMPDEPWDLGHDDDDRTMYRGPEHANRCNRSAAGRRSHEADTPTPLDRRGDPPNHRRGDEKGSRRVQNFWKGR